MNLFYPELAVTIGSYTLRQGIRVAVYSDRASACDWAKVTFSEDFPAALSIEERMPAAVWLGYDGQLTSVFQGYVAQSFSGAVTAREVILKDAALLLDQTKINHVFVSAEPQEIIRFVVGQAGVQEIVTPSAPMTQKAVVPIFGTTAADAIRLVSQLWNLTVTGYFRDGVYYWGQDPPQAVMVRFEYAENIISLGKTDGLWCLTTVSAPFVKHSQKIALAHPQLSGVFPVKKVAFTSDENGFIRTRIYF